MNLGFSELIGSIESELQMEYMPGAIKWCDEKFDGAWSKALNRFDKALSVAIERQDHTLAKVEGEYYKATILDLIRKFKTAKRIEESDSFLKSLESTVPRGAA